MTVHRHLQRHTLLLTLILTILVSAAGLAAAATPQGTLTVGLRADAESMDPHFVYHPSGFAVMEALYDSLVIADWDGMIVPHLAKSWSVEDNTTIQFVLRDDVVFHNGEPFDADAVKFSIERVLDEELQSGLRSRYTVIETVEVVDPLRVRLHLSRPDSSIMWSLTELAIVPPQYVQAVGAVEFARAPVGTGPFRFVEWLRDNRIVLEANTNYFTDSIKGQPGVARTEFRILPEDATRVAELRAGGVHLIEQLPVDLALTVQNSGMRVVPADTGRFFVAWLVSDAGGPVSDPRVRQALNYAMNNEAVISALFRGFAVPIASPFTPSTLGYDSSIPPYPYDLAKARQLLTEAGYPNGFPLTIDTTANRATEAQLIGGLLGEIGIEVTVRPLEASIFNTNWTTGDTGELIAASWGAAGDPQQYLDMLVASNGFLSRYDNSAVDELIARSAVTLDPAERTQILGEIQQLLRDDPAALYLWSAADMYGLNPSVQNWRPHSTERLIISNVTVK